MARVYTGLDVNGDQGGLFPWQSRLVEVGEGVRQAVVDEGPKNPPLTFVLLHGNPTWGFLYRKFIPGLSKRYRVIVPDHVGFGRSDKPEDPAYYSLERHIRNLESLLSKLHAENVIPVMQDWGGPIGTGWAVRHPERLAGLGILNTWAFVRTPRMKLPWLFRYLVLGDRGWKRVVENNFFVERIIPRSVSRKLTPAEMDAYRAPFPTPAVRVGIARFPQLIPESTHVGHESWTTMDSIESALPSLAKKPALIVWAQRDVAFRKPFLERWQSSFLDLDGPHLLPNSRHYSQEDAPDAIVSRLEAFAARILKAGEAKKADAQAPVAAAGRTK